MLWICILFSNAMNFTHDEQSVDYDFTSEDVLILNELQITTVAICLSVTKKAKILFPEKKNQNMANSFHLRLNHKRKKEKQENQRFGLEFIVANTTERSAKKHEGNCQNESAPEIIVNGREQTCMQSSTEAINSVDKILGITKEMKESVEKKGS